LSRLALDHLVVAADTLEQGAAWCKSTLGVAPCPGGRHPLMGTHNRLLKIATEACPSAYLEIIAIDPAAPPPGRVRWFGLDDAALRARLRQSPRLIHWVARSTQLDAHRADLLDLGHAPGEPVRASRQTPHGLLSWRIALRDDGALECGGALPTLIQWDGGHPAQALPDSGVTLAHLALRGLGPSLGDLLPLRGVSLHPDAGPALRATLRAPVGDVTLESR